MWMLIITDLSPLLWTTNIGFNGHQLPIKGRVMIASVRGLSPTHELKRSGLWGANHLHDDMRRVSARDPC